MDSTPAGEYPDGIYNVTLKLRYPAGDERDIYQDSILILQDYRYKAVLSVGELYSVKLSEPPQHTGQLIPAYIPFMAEEIRLDADLLNAALKERLAAEPAS